MAANVKVSEQQAVKFGTGGTRDLLCDIYTPENKATSAPAVLMLYGGGWRMGDRSRMRDASLTLARHGFVCVAGEYRLNPQASWPDHIHDVKAAIRWMRANAATLGIDSDKIAIEGHSAGAHLALLAAGTPNVPEFEGDGGNAGVSSEVAAVVAVYPPVAFHVGEQRPSGSTPANALMGESATAERAQAASPITYVSAAFPPTFLLHGSADQVVPPSASSRMYEAMRNAGAPVEMHMFAGLPHGFGRLPSLMEQIQGEIANFLHRQMVSPATIAAELTELAAQMQAARQTAPAE